MPKPIKRRIDAPTRKGAEDHGDILHRLAAEAKARQRQITITVGAALALCLVILGSWYYTASTREKADLLQYQGLRYFEAAPGYEALPEAERMAKAAELFRESHETRQNPFSLYYVGLATEGAGRTEDAVGVYREFMKAYPADPRFTPLARYRLAMALLTLGKMDEAIAELDAFSTQAAPAMKDVALMEAAKLLESLGRTEEAQARYEMLVKTIPTSTFVGEAISKTGAIANAVEGAIANAPASE
jgi:TolA-binding protein